MTIYVGFDIGMAGGLSGIKNGEIVFKEKTPINGNEVDLVEIKNRLEWLILEHGRVIVTFESVGAMPGQGVTSMFTFGKQAGRIEGLCIGMGLPFHRVPPRTWQKELWEGVTIVKKADGKTDTKKTSYLALSRLFPKIDFRASERAKNPHDGIVDACLIALYSYRKNF